MGTYYFQITTLGFESLTFFIKAVSEDEAVSLAFKKASVPSRIYHVTYTKVYNKRSISRAIRNKTLWYVQYNKEGDREKSKTQKENSCR